MATFHKRLWIWEKLLFYNRSSRVYSSGKSATVQFTKSGTTLGTTALQTQHSSLPADTEATLTMTSAPSSPFHCSMRVLVCCSAVSITACLFAVLCLLCTACPLLDSKRYRLVYIPAHRTVTTHLLLGGRYR